MNSIPNFTGGRNQGVENEELNKTEEEDSTAHTDHNVETKETQIPENEEENQGNSKDNIEEEEYDESGSGEYNQESGSIALKRLEQTSNTDNSESDVYKKTQDNGEKEDGSEQIKKLPVSDFDSKNDKKKERRIPNS